MYTAKPRIEGSNPSLSANFLFLDLACLARQGDETDVYGDPRWRLATLDSEPRQARKGATVVVDAGAEGTLAGVAASPMRRRTKLRRQKALQRSSLSAKDP